MKVPNSLGVKHRGNQRRMRNRGFLGSQAGQTAAEYLGVLLVVAAIIVAIGASGIAGTVSREIESAICSIGGGPCESQADSQPDDGNGAALAQIRERTPQRAAEERQRQQSAAESILRDDVSTPQVVGDSSAVPAGEPGASIAEAQRALARERLTGRPLPPFLTEPQQQRALSNRLLVRNLRALDPTPPTPFDQDGDGIEELRPPPAPEEGNAGDRFAGELCGLTQGIPLVEDGTCGLGDDGSTGFQQGRELGAVASTCCPRPVASSRRRSRGSGLSVTRARPNADGKASSTERGPPGSDRRTTRPKPLPEPWVQGSRSAARSIGSFRDVGGRDDWRGPLSMIRPEQSRHETHDVSLAAVAWTILPLPSTAGAAATWSGTTGRATSCKCRIVRIPTGASLGTRNG